MKNNKGFSLVELIVVIAIMAILAAVAIPTFASFIQKANKAADEDFAHSVEYAVDLALAGEAEESETITVVMDKTTKKVKSISYTLASDAAQTPTTYIVMGGTVNGGSDFEKIASTITQTVDKDYTMKTKDAFTFGKVSVSISNE
ncbi:MAG: type II secretion system protein [Ruminococcaceae bacterium]|nr:type II secretion system protein [Oscillospiraceae bacterium]